MIERRDRVRRLVVASSMVVYGEGAYRCPEHGDGAPPRRGPPSGCCAARVGARVRGAAAASSRPCPPPRTRPLRPSSVYGITKRDQEELVLVLGRAYGMETVALRYLNIYGPRQALGNPYTGVAAIFAARVLAGRRPRVFEDGGQMRDLVHVSDVVARHARRHGRARRAPGRRSTWPPGDGVTRGRAGARGSPRRWGRTLEPEVTGEFRAGDIRHCFADTSRARELLGFEAAVHAGGRAAGAGRVGGRPDPRGARRRGAGRPAPARAAR